MIGLRQKLARAEGRRATSQFGERATINVREIQSEGPFASRIMNAKSAAGRRSYDRIAKPSAGRYSYDRIQKRTGDDAKNVDNEQVNSRGARAGALAAERE